MELLDNNSTLQAEGLLAQLVETPEMQDILTMLKQEGDMEEQLSVTTLEMTTELH